RPARRPCKDGGVVSRVSRSRGVSRATACRSCSAKLPSPFLSLGRMPLANRLLAQEELGRPESTVPLEVAFCERCALMQLTHTVSPVELFSDYVYFSSYSDTMLAHAKAMAESLIERLQLGPKSQVVEIASNDGYLLRNFMRRAIPAYGIEP